ncbi:MAG: hypothetical protein M3Q39_15955 [Actinomycetota bacterium]|nr:hypothetical protein [Actinomycetota bacterium]
MKAQTQTMTEGLADLVASLEPILDAVEGHREAMKRRGFSETASEKLAVQFHAMLVTVVAQAGGNDAS